MKHSNLCVFLHFWKSCSLHSFITEVLETLCKSASSNGAKEQNLHERRPASGVAVLPSGARHSA